MARHSRGQVTRKRRIIRRDHALDGGRSLRYQRHYWNNVERFVPAGWWREAMNRSLWRR